MNSTLLLKSVFFLFISTLFIPISSFAQEQTQSDTINFLVVEEKPIFKGCERYEDSDERYDCFIESMTNHLIKKFKYPKKAKIQGIQGRVFVSFIINEKGKVKNIEVAKSAHPLLDKEAVRIIKKLKKFTPAKQKGEPIAISFTIPINFRLQ